MLVTLLATIGVGAQVMITKIVHLVLCTSTFRRVRQDPMGRRLSGRMEQFGMVSLIPGRLC